MANIQNVPLNSILVNKETKLLNSSESSVNEMVKSYDRNGGKFLQPIIVDQDYNLIDGETRLRAAIKIGLETIVCEVVYIKQNYERLNIEIDSNLERRELSTLERAMLLNRRKEAYELEHPTSTKEFKCKNNAKSVENRVETAPRYENVVAKQLGLSPKTIENEINPFKKINENNPELMERLIDNEKSTNNRVQKVELLGMSKLTPEQSSDLLELIKLEPPVKKGDLKKKINQVEEKDSVKGMNEQELFHQVFLHDLSKLISNDERFSSMKEKINVDVDSVSQYKQSKKLDFTNEIKFILENLK